MSKISIKNEIERKFWLVKFLNGVIITKILDNVKKIVQIEQLCIRDEWTKVVKCNQEEGMKID